MAGRSPALALLILAAGLSWACSAAIDPAAIEDAQTAVRVKTALVNDDLLGVRAVAVRVVDAVAFLSGRVASDTEVERAKTLAQTVPGVTRVESELLIGLPDPAPPPAGPAIPGGLQRTVGESPEDLNPVTDRRLLALGGLVGWSGPRDASLGSTTQIGPVVRIGRGGGLGLTFGLGWFATDALPATIPGDPLGRVRIRPIMGGVGYTVGGSRASASFSLVGGVALNSVVIGTNIDPHELILGVDDSFAWRPAVSFWFDASDRIALTAFSGYVLTRPEATYLTAGEVTTRRLDASTVLAKVGLAYKLF